jgi:hypothetical protein
MLRSAARSSRAVSHTLAARRLQSNNSVTFAIRPTALIGAIPFWGKVVITTQKTNNQAQKGKSQ